MVPYMCICQYIICIKYLAFLNCRQIRVLVLRLATFRTCNPAPPQTEYKLSECSARLLGTSPARSAFAGKVSECVCVCAITDAVTASVFKCFMERLQVASVCLLVLRPLPELPR